jgi:hypothetical protein
LLPFLSGTPAQHLGLSLLQQLMLPQSPATPLPSGVVPQSCDGGGGLLELWKNTKYINKNSIITPPSIDIHFNRMNEFIYLETNIFCEKYVTSLK